jgi:hypothetical protein
MTGKEHALRVLGFARKTLLALIEDLPDDRLCWQPFAGANHVLWNLGHIGTTDEWGVTVFDLSAAMDERMMKLFGSGSTPTSDAKAYPSKDAVLAYLHRSHERLIAAVNRASETDLATPLPPDYSGFAPDKLGLLYSLAWHEGFHTGQINACRKALGFKPKFM